MPVPAASAAASAAHPESLPVAGVVPALGAMIVRVQSRFIRAAPLAEVFEPLLTDLLEFTGSRFGFVGEVHHHTSTGAPYLRMLALTDIAWDAATRALVASHHSGTAPLEFHNLQSLYGQPLQTGLPVIANAPDTDPRRAGLPPGHPPLLAFAGVPLFHGGEMVGMVGLANRDGGYDAPSLAFLEPLMVSVAAIIDAVRLERGRREAEHMLRDTFELAAVGISHVALDGRFLRVNPRMCELLGLPAGEIQRLRFHDITHPDDIDLDLRQLHTLLNGEITRYTMEKRYRLPRQPDTLIWVQLTVGLVRDRHGRPDYLISVVEDINARKANEAHVLAVQAAERANAAKTEFLSRMSHELRTPLNAVLGFAQLLRLNAQQPLHADQLLKVQRIEQAGAHLLEMINDVLDLSHIESGHLSLSLRPVALLPLVEEVASLLAADAQARDVHIQLQPPEDDGAAARLMTDPLRLRQVLINLLSNAVKYNRPHGRVRVRWQLLAEPGWLRFDVIDTGPGLSPEQQAHLFEPFNRLGAERSEVPGTGIGLVITERLVRGMGGRLRVVSAPGQGCVFSVDLPHDPAVCDVAHRGPRADTQEPAPVFEVLYAEGDALNVALMRSLVALRPHCQLQVADSARSALQQARARPPGLLLMDMDLPDLPGLALAQQWLADPQLSQVPVVVLSSDDSAESSPEAAHAAARAAAQAGVVARLSKPIDVAALLALLDRLAAPASR
jgi:PAS domain S-box-containing protein